MPRMTKRLGRGNFAMRHLGRFAMRVPARLRGANCGSVL